MHTQNCVYLLKEVWSSVHRERVVRVLQTTDYHLHTDEGVVLSALQKYIVFFQTDTNLISFMQSIFFLLFFLLTDKICDNL